MHRHLFVVILSELGRKGLVGAQGEAVTISSGKDHEVPHWRAVGPPVLKLRLPTILHCRTPLRSSHPPSQERLGESFQRKARLLNKINYVQMKKHVQRFPKTVKGTGIRRQIARFLESLNCETNLIKRHLQTKENVGEKKISI